MATGLDTQTAQRVRIVSGRLARALRPTEAGLAAELTPTRVIVLLSTERNGPIRLSELAESEGLNPTLLSRAVANLADAGLIARSADPADRRSAWVEVTDAGRGLAQRIRDERTASVDHALAQLPADERRSIEAALPALEHLAQRLQDGDR